MQEGWAQWSNPSSPHAEGRAARRALEDARDRVTAALDWTGEVIFTSGASEALALAMGRTKLSRVLVSATEHDAVFGAAPEATVIPMNENGTVDREFLKAATADGEPPLVAIQHLNSETGTIQPVGELSELVRERGGLLLSDCSQSAGKLPLPDADFIVVSAHKFGGPIGVGALLVRDYAMLEPTGGHERGYRRGTENLPAVLGMAAALEAGGLESWATSDAKRRVFHEELASDGGLIAPGEQCGWIFALAHPTMKAQTLLIRLDAKGFAVSAGSACSSGTLKRSRTLEAFRIAEDIAVRTIRISLGWNTEARELERFLQVWQSLIRDVVK